MTRARRHFIKIENGDDAVSWCHRMLSIRKSLWTRIFSVTDCDECIEEVHAMMHAKGLDPMKDPIP